MLSAFVIAALLAAGQGNVATPCAKDSPAWRETKAKIDAFDALLERARSNEDGRKVRAAVDELRGQACLFYLRESDRDVEEASLVELKSWWSDGGEKWVRSYLELAGPNPQIVIPPDFRQELEVEPKHPLHPLLCAEDDAACDEGDRWRAELQRALEAQHVEEQKRYADEVPRDACKGTYADWRICIEDRRPRQTALPLGRWRLPDSGWLVIRGRRGHYSFCDEVRAYSLKSGAAYVSSSCSKLFLQDRGTVDAKETNKKREGTVHVGTLPLAELRRAAMAILMIPHVEEQIQRKAAVYPLPQGLKPSWPADELHASGLGKSFWMSSAQTRLAWTFRDARGVTTHGHLTWPDSANLAEAVAAQWLSTLEAKLAEGCPPEPLPPALLTRTPMPRVNPIDAPGGVESVQDARALALLEWRPPEECRKPADAGTK